ncbi:MAG: alpha/beta hydrolase [Acidimicrobiia bacterium]|nr:alpha/beta hydrolase [Acidimicrobiia bacterium]
MRLLTLAISISMLIVTGCTEPAAVNTAMTTPTTTTSTTVPPGRAFTTHERIPFTDLLVLDVFQPTVGSTGTVAVLVHGGGWIGGERADVADLANLLATGGVLTYNIAYRTMALGGRYPTSYEDVACGVRFARATATEYGGDPEQIILIGYSAGAHLSAVIALAGEEFTGECVAEEASPLPDGFVGLAGPYDSDEFSPLLIPFFGGSATATPDSWAAGNPFSYVARRPTLPIHLLHGAVDGTVPVSFTTDFADALESAGHQLQMTVIEGAGHRDMVDPAGEGPRVVEAVLGLLP